MDIRRRNWSRLVLLIFCKMGKIFFKIHRILDIIVCEKEEGKEGKILTKFYYNNFLLQNDYYIKGFGL